MRRATRQTGVTLVEIIFVVVLLGVLATVTLNTTGLLGNDLSRLLEAEDRVITELRRARAAALYRLPEDTSGTDPTETAAIESRAREVAQSISVDPSRVEYGYTTLGQVERVACQTGTCPAAAAQYRIEISLDGQSSCLQLTTATGRVEKASCPP